MKESDIRQAAKAGDFDYVVAVCDVPDGKTEKDRTVRWAKAYAYRAGAIQCFKDTLAELRDNAKGTVTWATDKRARVTMPDGKLVKVDWSAPQSRGDFAEREAGAATVSGPKAKPVPKGKAATPDALAAQLKHEAGNVTVSQRVEIRENADKGKATFGLFDLQTQTFLPGCFVANRDSFGDGTEEAVSALLAKTDAQLQKLEGKSSGPNLSVLRGCRAVKKLELAAACDKAGASVEAALTTPEAAKAIEKASKPAKTTKPAAVRKAS